MMHHKIVKKGRGPEYQSSSSAPRNQTDRPAKRQVMLNGSVDDNFEVVR